MKHVFAAAAAFALCLPFTTASGAASCAEAPISAGYGADGPYSVTTMQLANPGDARDEMTIYLPKGAVFPRPVVFFAHGFGPGRSSTHADLIHHMTSKGNIVVFSTYPTRGASIAQRYESLWQGFAAAADGLGAKADLSRVAFIGHSFLSLALGRPEESRSRRSLCHYSARSSAITPPIRPGPSIYSTRAGIRRPSLTTMAVSQRYSATASSALSSSTRKIAASMRSNPLPPA